MKITSIIMRGEFLPSLDVVIGGPVKCGDKVIGNIVSAKVIKEGIQVVAELNEDGKDIYNEITKPEKITFSFEE